MKLYTRPFLATLIVVASVCLLSGCVSKMGVKPPPGMIFQETTSPLGMPFDASKGDPLVLPQDYKTGETSRVHFFGVFYRLASVGWGDSAWQEAVEDGDITEAVFADVNTLMILGIYEQHKITVYGK